MFELKDIHVDYPDRHKLVLSYQGMSTILEEGKDYSPEFSKQVPALEHDALLRLMLDGAVDVHPYVALNDFEGWMNTKAEGESEEQWNYGRLLHTKFQIILRKDFEAALEMVRDDPVRTETV